MYKGGSRGDLRRQTSHIVIDHQGWTSSLSTRASTQLSMSRTAVRKDIKPRLWLASDTVFLSISRTTLSQLAKQQSSSPDSYYTLTRALIRSSLHTSTFPHVHTFKTSRCARDTSTAISVAATSRRRCLSVAGPALTGMDPALAVSLRSTMISRPIALMINSMLSFQATKDRS
jgi:hypothetical protein